MNSPEHRIKAYEGLLEAVHSLKSGDRRGFVDLAWPLLHPTGVSWIGFYNLAPGGQQMILDACRNRPACSPIGLHGVCGQALLQNTVRIVEDVEALGEAYVACDPADRSEIVLPCGGSPPGAVLDLDSTEVGSFDARDAEWLQRCLVASGLA